jgi:hypothetical protein
LSISPDGHLATPHVSGWGTTGADGKVEVIATRSDFGYVTVTGSILQDSWVTSDETTIVFGYVNVGFVYNICASDGTNVPDIIESYFLRIATRYSEVAYNRIDDLLSLPSSSYNVVFLFLPNNDLSSSQITALNNFVNLSKKRRVVLVGEYVTYSPTNREYNARLNSVATGIGMICQFDVGNGGADSGFDLTRLCRVESSHYLMEDVSGLWDSATDTFQTGWESYARPLVYIHDNPTLPWILEEDIVAAGSRIAIHDSSMFHTTYDDRNDAVPDKNFRFVYNLCTKFKQ